MRGKWGIGLGSLGKERKFIMQGGRGRRGGMREGLEVGDEGLEDGPLKERFIVLPRIRTSLPATRRLLGYTTFYGRIISGICEAD